MNRFMQWGATTLTALVITCLAIGVADAKKRTWYKYENGYFEVYSDAPEKRVRDLLKELEDFRAAVVQVLTLSIPPGAVKTQIVIFRSQRELRELTKNRHTGAFAVGVNGVPYMVMSTGPGKLLGQIIRHEYTHVLLGYSEFRFPPWFHEGMAEFMSATQIKNGGTQFTYGDLTSRPRAGPSLVPWAELMSDSFSFATIRSPELKSNAYLQAWLLSHYFMWRQRYMADARVKRYFGRFSAGESSVSALEAEFDMTPTELGHYIESAYGKEMKYATVTFEHGARDNNFTRSEVSTDQIEDIVSEIESEVSLSRMRERVRGSNMK